jgi:hypothetical protein
MKEGVGEKVRDGGGENTTESKEWGRRDMNQDEWKKRESDTGDLNISEN